MDRLITTKTAIFIAILFANFCIGQTMISNEKLVETSSKEKIYLHLNSTVLLTGEKLLYKISCLKSIDNQPSKISKVGYVVLLDKNKKIVFNHKIYFENGQGQGDYFVTANLVSGNYKLIGYTNWMLNSATRNIFEANLTIINPFQSLENSDLIKSDFQLKPIVISETKNPFFSIESNKMSFATREKISLKIKGLPSEKGVFSLSIRKKDSLYSPSLTTEAFTENSKTKKLNTLSENKPLILPEIRGENFIGKITNQKNALDIANKTIVMSIPGESFIFKTVKTNTDGAFVFTLEVALENKTTIFEVLEENPEDFSLVILPKPMPNLDIISVENGFQLSKNLLNTIQDRSVASQIENSYFEIKKDSYLPIPRVAPFYQSYDIQYLLDDFSKFPDLKETIVEVTTELNYKFKKNKYELFAKNSDTNDNMETPALVLIDGLMIRDLNQLFDYKIDNIYKISTTSGNFLYDSAKQSDGIVSITTRSLDFENKESGSYIQKLQIDRPIFKKDYYYPTYDETTKLSTIPDYRQQLLWLPRIDINEIEKEIVFYSSDISGNFIISLEGFTSSGKPVSITQYFNVK